MIPVPGFPTSLRARVIGSLALLAGLGIVACSGNDGGGAGAGGAPGFGGDSARGGQPAMGGAATGAGGAPAAASGGSSFGGSGSGGSAPASGGTSSGGTGVGGQLGGASSGGAAGTGRGGATASGSGGRSAGGSASGGTSGSGGGSSASGGVAGAPANLPALSIYIAGDSTVSNYTDTSATNDQAGWGQMLHEIFNDKVKIVNKAAGGRTAYWFYLEGAVTTILNQIKPGDYFFIQFGTNDQNTTATFEVDGKTYPRYADTATFKTQLKQYYLDPAKAKSAIPVLVTPPPRNSAYCNGGNGLGSYATAMIELGKAENVAVLDNNAKTFNYLKAICPKPTAAADETFFKNNDGSIDGTHFQENGARKMAGFIGEEIRRVNLGLAAYLR